jgi:hypothetical protein
MINSQAIRCEDHLVHDQLNDRQLFKINLKDRQFVKINVSHKINFSSRSSSVFMISFRSLSNLG